MLNLVVRYANWESVDSDLRLQLVIEKSSLVTWVGRKVVEQR
jgi:hypothetical protein